MRYECKRAGKSVYKLFVAQGSYLTTATDFTISTLIRSFQTPLL